MIDIAKFQKYKINLFLVIFTAIIFSYTFFKPSNKYTKKDLLVNINKANLNQLISIPYIGKKTAENIIKLRDKKGYIKNINQLKFLKNFKKFKEYIKVKDAT